LGRREVVDVQEPSSHFRESERDEQRNGFGNGIELNFGGLNIWAFIWGWWRSCQVAVLVHTVAHYNFPTSNRELSCN
jgi:hypothetical protein